MIWRRLIPFGTVGALGCLALASAAIGVGSSSSTLSARVQSSELQAAVRRTLDSTSFLVHSPGQVLIYQAPNRTEVVASDPSANYRIAFVTIGSSSYVDFGLGHWFKASESSGFGGLSYALGALQALTAFPTATLNGNVYTVHGVLSHLPQALVRVIFTSVVKTPNGPEIVFSVNNPNERAMILGRITVQSGIVTSESFSAIGAYGTRHGHRSVVQGTVSYSAFGVAPRIAIPTKAELSPCTPSSGENSALCQQISGIVSPTVVTGTPSK